MNVLFLTTGTMASINQRSIYPDLLRCFKNNGHNVFAVSSYEKRIGKKTEIVNEDGANMLHVQIGNLTKTNFLEKGISTIMIEKQYLSAIKKYLSDVKFDLVMYSTPPITLVKVVDFIKKRDGAKAYLLLKDIFPQNAVDLGIISKNGFKGLIYKFFRNKEKKLYKTSDYIGCMSQANVNYILNHNPYIDPSIVEVCPNCVEILDMSVDTNTRKEIRKKYNIPLDKKIFIYGGNLGKPQGIDFMISCLKSQEKKKEIFFLIIGDGTEFGKIETYINSDKPNNVRLMKRLTKEDYDKLVGACDVGLIFLDHRFTIPNFPSRLLSYMQAKIPVFAITDCNTDIGKVIVEGGFGWWCESNDIKGFAEVIESIKSNCDTREIEFSYLQQNYSVEKAYKIIMEKFSEK